MSWPQSKRTYLYMLVLKKQQGLWVREGVSTLLVQSLFSPELLGFSSMQWDWMEGTVPSADKHKFQMVPDQWAGPSPGTAWSRKQIITDVHSLASDFGAKEIQNLGATTKMWKAGNTPYLFQFWSTLDSKGQTCLFLSFTSNDSSWLSSLHTALHSISNLTSTSTDPEPLVLSPFQSLPCTHMSHCVIHTQAWTDSHRHAYIQGTQRNPSTYTQPFGQWQGNIC